MLFTWSLLPEGGGVEVDVVVGGTVEVVVGGGDPPDEVIEK
jgi:hypothetical protein